MNWLRDYLELTAGQESPEKFHLWSGIALIAATMGRNTFLVRRSQGITRFTNYPGTMQILLVAPSGIRKSSAMYPIISMANMLKLPVLGGKNSTENFIRQLDPTRGGANHGIVIEDEATNFINNKGYTDGMVEVLCDLADGKGPKLNTNQGGGTAIKDPSIAIVLATTPEGVASFPPAAQGKGWLSRVITVYEDKTDRIEPLTDIDDEDVKPEKLAHMKQVVSNVYTRLNEIRQLNGPFKFSPGGKAWFDNWYRNYKGALLGEAVEGYPNRRPEHLLKVGMVFSAAASDDKLLTDPFLIAADAALADVEKDFPKALSLIGGTKSRERDKILEFMKSKGGKCTFTEIVNYAHRFYTNLEEIGRAMMMLVEAGFIECTQQGDKSKKIQQVWALTRKP